jgi:hypothetical protein
MVNSDELNVGDEIYKIGDEHVHGFVQRLRVLGQKNFFSVQLSSGQIILVRKPEDWEYKIILVRKPEDWEYKKSRGIFK